MRATITIDTRKAEKILRDTGRRVRSSSFRNIARPAAKIVEQDLSTTAPLLKDNRRYHTFSRKKTGYKMWIKRGNLRKSMKTFIFKNSRLLWVGSRYGVGKNGATIGGSKANSDGFYDNFLVFGTRPRGKHPGIQKTDYIGNTKNRTEAQVKAQLERDGNAFIAKIAAKANATP